jgi:hypothetical protein
MADDLDPPRKFYGLKPKGFERVNAPPRETPPPGVAADPGIVPPAVGAIDVRELARQASRGTPLLGGSNAPANRANEVHAILRGNLDIANATGLNDVAPIPKRRSRRNRDFFVAFIAGNALLILGTLLQPVFGGAGLVLYNVGLPWVMFAVMDDY